MATGAAICGFMAGVCITIGFITGELPAFAFATIFVVVATILATVNDLE